jgi:hypothetical protein
VLAFVNGKEVFLAGRGFSPGQLADSRSTAEILRFILVFAAAPERNKSPPFPGHWRHPGGLEILDRRTSALPPGWFSILKVCSLTLNREPPGSDPFGDQT